MTVQWTVRPRGARARRRDKVAAKLTDEVAISNYFDLIHRYSGPPSPRVEKVVLTSPTTPWSAVLHVGLSAPTVTGSTGGTVGERSGV